MIPETDPAATPGIFTRVCSRASLCTALEEVTVLVTAAIDGRRVAASLGRRATEQLTRARAVAQVQAAPLNDLTLLVHLTAARTFLTDGWAPPPLIAELNAAIARIHHLARTAPDVFRPTGSAPVTTVLRVKGARAPRTLP
jgi:hypothetical protein